MARDYINPSIGLVGRAYYDKNNNRIKYFSIGIHSSLNSIDIAMRECLAEMRRNAATRVNARFLLKGNYQENVEAKIPLNNGFAGVQLFFIGINHPTRLDRADVLAVEDSFLSEIVRQQRHNRREIPKGYDLERLTTGSLRRGDIEAMLGLYNEAFTTYTIPLNLEKVREMVENSVIYAVRDKEGKIVSTVIAEITAIDTPIKPFRICELSEMATRRAHRGKGLVTFATQKLIDEIKNELDLIYAEARACHRPINQAFFNLGFNYAGRLMKQCILSGDHEVSEQGPYENLNVWYMLPPKDES